VYSYNIYIYIYKYIYDQSYFISSDNLHYSWQKNTNKHKYSIIVSLYKSFKLPSYPKQCTQAQIVTGICHVTDSIQMQTDI